MRHLNQNVLFSFFQKNSYLQDIIVPNYVDIHSHLLPGIDDGASKIEDTKKLIEGLHNIGFSAFITTPHIMSNVWENTAESITSVLESTSSALAVDGLKVKLHAAAEYMIDDNFMSHIQSGTALTLSGKHILVELSYLNPPLQLLEIIFDIQLAGYIPVLAHPERYNFYHNNFIQYQNLKNAGCKFQLNLLSTVGYYGHKVANAASELLQKDMIDFTGSDVHHQKHLDAFSQKISNKNAEYLKAAMQQNQLFSF